MSTRRPTAFEVLAALLASVPAEISYSGSDVWRIAGQRDLRSPEADGGEPFAIELSIDGFPEPYVIVLADRKDVEQGGFPIGNRFQQVTFETDNE